MTRHYLYRISVPHGRAYIGITVLPQRRFAEHLCADTAIGHAIRQHGPDNCKFEILREGSEFDIKDLENRYIRLFKTQFPAGYNNAPSPGALEGRERFLESLKLSSPLGTQIASTRSSLPPHLPKRACTAAGSK